MRRRKRKPPPGAYFYRIFLFSFVLIIIFWMIGRMSPTWTPGSIDMGVALHPEDLPRDEAIPRAWKVPPVHQLSYGLGTPEASQIRSSYADYQRRMNARREGEGIWQTAPPPCRLDLRCVYEELAIANESAVLPIAERFLNHARSRQLDASALARLIITYVQSIRYRIVKNDPYGLVPPAIVVNSTGDCDSKGLLAIMLLRMADIDAVMLVSQTARHAMVGVALPMGRDRIHHRGKSYAIVEVTYPNWPIGHMPPKYASRPDWSVVPIQFWAY
jgi:hypothetical protein